MLEKILCVDDDVNILQSYQRQLRKYFNIDIAAGTEQGLDIIDSKGPYAVVLADFQMPDMNGVEFLAAARQKAPDTVRMMLTGNADLTTAIEAINTGNIFRFLTKPCSPEQLCEALKAGIKQYRLVTTEHDMLKNTLTGSVMVLTEILSTVNSVAFSRASRIRRYVKSIAAEMKLPDLWQYEVAAMLSQIGCIALPPQLVNKITTRKVLSPDEEKAFVRHPKIAGSLLSKIPRLEPIAEMIEGQLQPFCVYLEEGKPPREDSVALGSQILKVALDFDQIISSGKSYTAALGELGNRTADYNQRVVEVFEKLLVNENSKKNNGILAVRVRDLKIGMIAAEDIVAKDGFLLVPKGHEMTHPVLLLLRNFAQGRRVTEPFHICAPCENLEDQPVAQHAS